MSRDTLINLIYLVAATSFLVALKGLGSPKHARKGNMVATQWGDAMLLDMRHLGEKKIDERLPLVRDMSISYMGVDPVSDPVPVRPVVHYMMGGVHTDMNGATPLEGLFAASVPAFRHALF